MLLLSAWCSEKRNFTLLQLDKSLRLHHFGYLTNSITTDLEIFSKIGFKCSSEVFLDSAREIEIVFLTIPGTDTLLELIQPKESFETQISNSRGSRLGRTLKDLMGKRSGLYHIGYTVQDPDFLPSDLRLRSISTREPAVALGGRYVEFFLTPTGAIFELIFNSEDLS
jgi:hypothetical protein